MIDIATSTTSELEAEQERLYNEFEAAKKECYSMFLKMGDIQKEFEAVDNEIKKRNSEG